MLGFFFGTLAGLFFSFMFLVSKRLFLRRLCKVFISEVMDTC